MKLIWVLSLLLFGCSPKAPEVSKICLEGHIYFKYADQLAIKLTDEGKPISCEKGLSRNRTSIDQNLVNLSLEWIKLVDEKRFDQSWELAAPFFKNAVTKADWSKAASMVDTQLGKILKREAIATLVTGDRAEVKFKSDFQNLSGVTETLLLSKVGGNWLVIGYLAN